MNEAEKRERLVLINEIKRRLNYLRQSSTISASEKIAIARKALQIIEQGKNNEEQVMETLHPN